MDTAKCNKLEAAGFQVGDAEDFLALTHAETALVDLRLKVSRMVRVLREKQELTQQDLAKRIKSSQSRIAKLESAASDVSLDLMYHAFFAVGGQLADVMGIAKTRATTRKTGRVSAAKPPRKSTKS